MSPPRGVVASSVAIAYTDAVSFAVMAASRCRHVLGFDQDFAAAGFMLWKGQRA